MKEYFHYLDDLRPLTPGDAQKAQLAQFAEFVLEWNEKLNLTAIRERKPFWIKHIYDSLTCLHEVFAFGSSAVIDIGTGAGFPGIPLKIAYPEMKLTLTESVKKKADFCQLAVDTLKLNDVQVIAERAETIGQDKAHREMYNWAVARAVAPLSVLVEYLLPLVHIGGAVLAQKGSNAGEEIRNAEKAIRVLGGEVKKIRKIELPENMGSRSLIVIKKVKATPAQYPRRPGVPKKQPIN